MSDPERPAGNYPTQTEGNASPSQSSEADPHGQLGGEHVTEAPRVPHEPGTAGEQSGAEYQHLDEDGDTVMP
jgi:hypothetical protein